jgi:hypothetical protein
MVADLEPARQLERHPSGLVPLGWAADARCPPPLSLPPHHHQQLSAASTDMRRSQPSPGGDAIGGSRGMSAVRPSSGPPTLPWYEGGGGGGSPVTLHGMSQPLQQGADAAGPAGLRYARPGSSSSAGAAPCGAAVGSAQGDEAEPRPRPSPWGLRPYGSPVVSSTTGGAAASQSPWVPRESQWADSQGPSRQQQGPDQPYEPHSQRYADEVSEDGARADGVRLGSPVRVERATAADRGEGAAAGAWRLGHVAQGAASGGVASASSLPALLGGPYAPSPRHMVQCGGGAFSPGRPRDVLRESLDTGRCAINAAAAAIATAEAAVMRGSGGGGGAGATGSPGPGLDAGASPQPDDPLRWSLRQSAHAVSGLAAALDAAASALHAPDAGAGRSAGLGSPPRPLQRIVVAPSPDWRGSAQCARRPGSAGQTAAAEGAPPSPGQAAGQWLEWQRCQPAPMEGGTLASAALAPPPSVVAVASWSPPDATARELHAEVARLRAEVRVCMGVLV